jgi:coenzyme F420-reducing hydrogenase alpha subunit
MNNIAQLVESVHVLLESIDMMGEILEIPVSEPIMADVKPKAGRGVAAVEVPRGILFHCYEYDSEGRILKADCVIPTTQNNANIHLDLGELVKEFATASVSDGDIELLCSMLVRAYDPCISCSVH